MKHTRISIAIIATILFVFSIANAQVSVIKAGKLVDPDTGVTVVNQTIIVEAGKITAIGTTLPIPAGATTIDLSKFTVLPGLFDAHTHMCTTAPIDNRNLFVMDMHDPSTYRAILGVANARAMLDSGFTTIRDVGNNGNYADSSLRRAIEEGVIPGPTIINAGRIIAPFGGQYHLQPERRELGEPEYLFADTRDEMRKAIRENIHFGAKVIKIVVDDQRYIYSVDDIKFIVSEAASAGLKVAAHCLTEQGARNAAEGGVASIEHGLRMSDEALQIAPQALTLWESIGDKRGIIRSHLMIGTFYLAQNSLAQSTQSNQTALNLADQKNFTDLKAEALINLGFVDSRMGAWQSILQRMGDAEKLIDAEAEPVRMTQIATSLAEAYIESGLPEIGVTKYKQALESIRKAHRARDEIVVLWGFGRALYFAKRYEEALPVLEKALSESEKQAQPVALSMCHDFIGRTLDGLGDHAAALTHLQKAVELYENAKNPMEVARTRALIGQIYEMSGRLEDARQFYRQSMQTFDRLSDRVNQSATLFALGRLEMKSGNYDVAEKYLRKSIDDTENVRRLSRSRDLTAAFSATVHDRYEQYIQCLMHSASDQSRLALAFETSDSARARSLAELLRVSDTNLLSNVDPELARRERELRQSLRMKEDGRVSLLATEYKTEQLQAFDAEMGKLKAEYNDVLAAINQRYPAYAQITQPQNWDLGRIQREVIGDDDTVLLEYFLGDERSYVWVVTRNSITSHELPSQTVIAKTVQSLFELLKQPANAETKDKLDQTARELARMILWPVAAELNQKRILVAADDALHYIPFQALPASENGAEPLLARYEIVNVPSASILGELRKEAARRGVRPKTLAAFGNPIFATDGADRSRAQEGRLFYSAREIENLRKVASEEQTFAAIEYDATREQLLKTDLTQFAILHIATHGRFDPERPENSGLRLSTIDRDGKTVNGFVGLQDVYSLRAPVDLVVLSACETGLGKEVRGEGLLGLTRGFMYAGGTSVVASLWKVEDEVTAELMKRFYTEMLDNHKTPAEALRAAQNSIRQVPEWSAPHYWAGFTLQGEYRYAVNTSHGWQWYWAALIVVGFVGLTAVFLYRRRRSA